MSCFRKFEIISVLVVIVVSECETSLLLVSVFTRL